MIWRIFLLLRLHGYKKTDRYFFCTCPVLVLYISEPNLQPDGCTALPMAVSFYFYSLLAFRAPPFGFTSGLLVFNSLILYVDSRCFTSRFRRRASDNGSFCNPCMWRFVTTDSSLHCLCYLHQQ